MAQFVRDNNIGVVIDSLEDLPQIPEKVNQEQYEEMMFNVNRIVKLVRDGFPMKWAVM